MYDLPPVSSAEIVSDPASLLDQQRYLGTAAYMIGLEGSPDWEAVGQIVDAARDELAAHEEAPTAPTIDEDPLLRLPHLLGKAASHALASVGFR